jgi:serine phosphatase RsbU (regulator of sigma subunit)
VSDVAVRLEAATAHLGSSLDLAGTAAEVVDAAVPGFADAAIVYATERLLAADEPPPEKGRNTILRRLAGRFEGFDAKMNESVLPIGEVVMFEPGTPGAKVMEMGRPLIYARHEDQPIPRPSARHGGDEGIVLYKSFLAMPLIARGRVLGCMRLCRAGSRPGFTDKDIELAAPLLDRAALCIDNARLYDSARRTSIALQRALMPPALVDIPSALEVASRYRPAGTHVIGGDWHDLVALPGNCAALIVGDAMGHGPEAAAAMVQLRTAAHALAAVEIKPAKILCELDRMTESIEAAPFATCLVMLVDTVSGSCTAARAGHLPPMIATPGGESKALNLPAGLQLGVGAASYKEARFDLPPGATLAVYTDGLVENRACPIDEGMAMLCDELDRNLPTADSPLDQACEELVRALGEHGGDDITLVLARVRR